MILELYYNNPTITKKHCRKYPSAYLYSDGLYIYSGRILLLNFSFGLNIKTANKKHITTKGNISTYKHY